MTYDNKRGVERGDGDRCAIAERHPLPPKLIDNEYVIVQHERVWTKPAGEDPNNEWNELHGEDRDAMRRLVHLASAPWIPAWLKPFLKASALGLFSTALVTSPLTLLLLLAWISDHCGVTP